MTPNDPTVIDVKPVQQIVTYVNHAGHNESAVVTSKNEDGSLSLDIQGSHPKDRYHKDNVPKGGPGKKQTWF